MKSPAHCIIVVLLFFFEIWSSYEGLAILDNRAIQADPKLAILLSQCSECRNYGYVPPNPGSACTFENSELSININNLICISLVSNLPEHYRNGYGFIRSSTSYVIFVS